MEPIYENISASLGSSFYDHLFKGGCTKELWHMHREFELVYIHSGNAVRHIGSNVSRYTNGDLLLIGSNIPHSNLGNNDYSDNYEIVVQMGVDFVEEKLGGFVEFMSVIDLFKRSEHGISFGANTKLKVGALLLELVQLESLNKLLKLIEILQELANTADYTLLNASSMSVSAQSSDYSRIQKINDYVLQHFQHAIHLSDMADLTGLTETSFSRFFKKVTGKTFSTFINEYRIQKASSLLVDTSNSISDVMHESGFTDPAHFSRTFKRITNHTPSDYRNKRRSIGSIK